MLGLGRLREAQGICNAVLQKDGSNANAWYLLSKAHLRGGHSAEAAQCAQRACASAPSRVELLIHSGTCLGASGRIREAALIAERAAALESASAPNLSNLGTLFSMCGAHAKAAAHFEKATRLDSSIARYWSNLASSLRALGEIQKAESACDKAIELDPGDGQAKYLRSDLRLQTPESNHVDELKAALAATKMTSGSRILCGFALAKELEDIGDYDASFKILTTATQAYRASIAYEVEDDITVIDALIARHTSDRLRALDHGHTDDAPIFIVGLPRSGTTLVERIIQSHSQVQSLGERNDFALELSRLAINAREFENPTRLELVEYSLHINMSELGSAYVNRIRLANDKALRLVDKMPINYLYCGLIHAALPNARIIVLRRNPMDSCYAAYKAFLRGPYSFTYNLSELGRYYLAFRRLTDHWRTTIPQNAYHEVDYESLVTNFERDTRRLIEFLGLPWEDKVLEFQTSEAASATASAVQVRRGIYSSSVGKWKHYARQLEPLLVMLQEEIQIE